MTQDNIENQAYEGLNLEFVPSPVGRRILSFIVDVAILSTVMNVFVILFVIIAIIIGGLSFLLLVQSKLTALSGAGAILFIFAILGAILLAAIIWHSYFIYFEHRRGWTPGKRLFGLSVISLDGHALTFRQCLMREIFRSYCDLPLFFPGIITILCSKKHQRVGDMVTGTLVVYSQRAENENRFLYLNRKQFEEREHRYKVSEYTLDEARKYLQDLFPLVLGPVAETKRAELLDYFSKKVTLEDLSYSDPDEMKIRYLGEFMLQADKGKL